MREKKILSLTSGHVFHLPPESIEQFAIVGYYIGLRVKIIPEEDGFAIISCKAILEHDPYQEAVSGGRDCGNEVDISAEVAEFTAWVAFHPDQHFLTDLHLAKTILGDHHLAIIHALYGLD